MQTSYPPADAVVDAEGEGCDGGALGQLGQADGLHARLLPRHDLVQPLLALPLRLRHCSHTDRCVDSTSLTTLPHSLPVHVHVYGDNQLHLHVHKTTK